MCRGYQAASSSLVVQLRFQLRFGNANAIGTLTKEQNCKFQLHLRFRGPINVSGAPITFLSVKIRVPKRAGSPLHVLELVLGRAR